MSQVSIEINGNLHFSQIWDGETLETVANMKMNIAIDHSSIGLNRLIEFFRFKIVS